MVMVPATQRDLAPVADTLGDADDVMLVTAGGSRASLPNELRQLLTAVVQAMLDGQDVIVAAKDSLVTAQEAADLLGVSRPTLIRILESGEIPYGRPNSHRRIRLADMVAYQERHAASRAALDDLLASSADLDEYDTGEFVRTR